MCIAHLSNPPQYPPTQAVMAASGLAIAVSVLALLTIASLLLSANQMANFWRLTGPINPEVWAKFVNAAKIFGIIGGSATVVALVAKVADGVISNRS